jgi:hypothetical protein
LDLVVNDGLDDLADEVPATGKDVHVVSHVCKPAALGVVSGPYQALLQRLGDLPQALPGRLFALDGFFIGQVGFA